MATPLASSRDGECVDEIKGLSQGKAKAGATDSRQIVRKAGYGRTIDASVSSIVTLHKLAKRQSAGRFLALLDVSSEAGCEEHPPHAPPCLYGGFTPNAA